MLTTNCSNNYGPYHFPEKLIPLMIVNALAGKPLPVYGDGLQVRDWLYVKDHCSAIREVLARGRVGETYNIGGWNEKPNIEIVHTVCRLLDEMRPDPAGSYSRLITHVTDRPGHDRRYAIDATQDRARTGMEPGRDLRDRHPQDRAVVPRPPRLGRQRAIGSYRDWLGTNYGSRTALKDPAVRQERSGRLGTAAFPCAAGRSRRARPRDSFPLCGDLATRPLAA